MKTYAIQPVEPIELQFSDNKSFILKFNTKGFFKMTAEMNKSSSLKKDFVNIKTAIKNMNEDTLQLMTTIVIKSFVCEEWTYRDGAVEEKKEITLGMDEALTLATEIPFDCLTDILESFSENLTKLDKKKVGEMQSQISQLFN